ncbi:MAG: Fur family transcriptional regulator [Clostridiales bacterium]
MILSLAISKIKSKGYKITKPREAILKILISSKNKMLSADGILKETQIICANINITTIYRNLEILENIGVIHKVVSSKGISLFKLLCNEFHHHHLICNYCGKVESIDFCPIEYYKKISADKDFYLTDHKLELYGFCKNCINSKKNIF